MSAPFAFPNPQVSRVPQGALAFAADFDPQTMIVMGIFGDAYFGDELGQARAKLLPSDWTLTKSGDFYTNTRGPQCKRINYHARLASETRQWWLDRQMICELDPLGWFEWYCHYWLGRRVARYDDWQIDRWRNFKARHIPMYYATRYPGSAQALLHWGIRAEGGLF